MNLSLFWQVFIIFFFLFLHLNKEMDGQENLIGKGKQDIIINTIKDNKFSIDKISGNIVERVPKFGIEVYSFDSLNNCIRVLMAPTEEIKNGDSGEVFLWTECNTNYTIIGAGKWKTICKGHFVYINEIRDPYYGNCFVWSY